MIEGKVDQRKKVWTPLEPKGRLAEPPTGLKSLIWQVGPSEPNRVSTPNNFMGYTFKTDLN